MTNSLYLALQHCLQLARQGVPLEECLLRYPQHAEELGPLLTAATSAPGLDTSTMPSEARVRVREKVLAEWDRRHRRRRRLWSAPAPPLRWAAIAAAIFVAILLSGAGTAWASQASVPGAAFYPVKRFQEEARLRFARSPEQQVDIYTQLVHERLTEFKKLLDTGQTDASPTVISLLEGHLWSINQQRRNAVPSQQGNPSGTWSAAIKSVEADITADPVVAAALQETVDQAPTQALECLRHILIRDALGAVDNARNSLGQDLPQPIARDRSGDAELCPR